MARVEDSADIRAPITAVFAAATDPCRAGEWNPGIIGIDNLSAHPVRLGTTWQQTVSAAGRQVTVICTVVKLDAPREGVLEISGPQSGKVTTRCRERGDSTHLSQTIEVDTGGGFKGGIMGKVVQTMLGRELKESLARMKNAVEQEARADRGSPSA